MYFWAILDAFFLMVIGFLFGFCCGVIYHAKRGFGPNRTLKP